MTAVALFITLFSSCRPDAAIGNGETSREHIRLGDQAFNHSHLRGWRDAAAHYQLALAAAPNPELRLKLFLTLALQAIREKEEAILNPAVYRQLDDLALSRRECQAKPQLLLLQQYLTEIRKAPFLRENARHQRSIRRIYIPREPFAIQNSPQDLWLYLHLLHYYSCDPRRPDEEYHRIYRDNQIPALLEKFRRHPLFIYSNFGQCGLDYSEIKKQFPGFAEMSQRHADGLFRKRQYSGAIRAYHEALRLIPDYSSAWTSLGNIFHLMVKNHETASEFYDKALAVDPTRPMALFGKGVSLHYLEKYRESLQTLDYMLMNNTPYRGEALYFKAYNHYKLHDIPAMTKALEQAFRSMPDPAAAHELMALALMDGKKYIEAENHLLAAIRDGENASAANALYLMGRLCLRIRNWNFFHYFTQAEKAYRSGLQNQRREMDEIKGLDVDAHIKKWMMEDRARKFRDQREMAESQMALMREVLAANRKNRPSESQDPFMREFFEEGNNAIHYAVFNDDVRELGELHGGGQDINARNLAGYTPMHYAVLLNRPASARFLAAKGAAIQVHAAGGFTPLHDAAGKGLADLVRLLLEHGADVYAADDIGMIPLDIAVANKQSAVFSLLNPLHNAIIAADLLKVREIIDARPHLLNLRDENGRTPLFMAVAHQKVQTVAYLLEQGADVGIGDNRGVSPCSGARLSGNREIREMLARYGAEETDGDMFREGVGAGAAKVWFIDRDSWFVRTSRGVILFNYYPYALPPMLQTREPLIRGDVVNALLMRDVPVVNLIANGPMGAAEMRHINYWGSSLREYFAVGYAPGVEEGRLRYLAPGGERRMGEVLVKSLSVGSVGQGAAYLVQAGKLVIFYAGKMFSGGEKGGDGVMRVCREAGLGKLVPDIAFLPVTGEGVCGEDDISLRFIREFSPLLVAPLHKGDVELYYGVFVRRLREAGLETRFAAAPYNGGLIHYSREPGA